MTLDPVQGLKEPVPGQPGSWYSPDTGTLHAEVPLDFMQTAESCGCGASALAYNSDSVDVRPVVQVHFGSEAGDPVPTLLQARLIWNNGAPGPWVTISTAGHNPGDTYSFALEQTTPVTTTGVYPWEVDVQATLPGGAVINRDVEGYTPVVANDASPVGAGWSVGKIDSLVPIAANGVVPAGVLYVYGNGQSRFFQAQGAGYLSPSNDFGTLTQSGGGYVYTDAHQLKHTFNAAGQLVSLSDAHGLSNVYSYTGSLLTGITMYDGGQTTFLYSGGLLSEVDEPGGRRVLVTHAGTDLTGVTNADGAARTLGYDGAHHLTSDHRLPLSAAYGYDAATGALTSITLANGQTLAVSPAWLRELLTGSALGASPPDTITDGLNRVTSLTLDGLGRLLSELAPDGSLWTQTLDFAGNVTAVTDALGRTTRYAYNYDPPGGVGGLTQVTYADGTTSQYQYDPAFHLPTLEVDPNGDRTSLTYDPTTGDLLTVTDALHHTTSYAYVQAGGHSNGEVQSVTDANGNVTQYAYDSARRVTQIIAGYGTAAAATTTMGYDGAGNLVSETTGQSGNNTYAHPVTTQYAFDGMRRLTQEIDAYGTPQQRTTTYAYDAAGDLASMTDGDGNVTTYAYDAAGHVTQRIDGFGTAAAVTTTMVYDNAGELTSETTGQSSNQTYAHPATTRFGYDGLGRVTSQTDGYGTPQQRTITTTYDLDGNVLTTTDANGDVTRYAYDALNRMVSETAGYGTAVASTTTMVYDAAGNLTSETVGQSSNPNYAHPTTTQYTFDALNRVVQEVMGYGTAAATTTTLAYDPAGNLSSETTGQSSNQAYAHPSTTTFGYDALNRRTTETDAYGTAQARTVTSVYDAAGDVVQTIDALNDATTYGYDALDRQISVSDPLGDQSTTAYDAVGNVLTTTDANGDQTQYAYDPLNRLITTTDANGGVTTTAYDAAGDRVSLTDPDGNVTAMAYDVLGRMTGQNDPLNHTTAYVYDPGDRLTSVTDALGRVRNVTYDALNRETGETWVVSGVTTNTQAFTYDAASNQLTAGDNSGTYTMTYDALDRMTSEQEPFALSLTFGYDAASDRVLVQDSFGGVTSSTYDALGRLTQRGFGGAGQTALHVNLTWTARDQLATLSRYNDQSGSVLAGTSNFVYDSVGRLASLLHADGNGNTLASYVETYDPGSRLTQETINGASTTYAYDKTNQLTQDGSISHGYDAAGNRNTAGYQVGAGNQITSDGVWTYTHDAAGELIKKSKGTNAETWTYGYDAKGRMVWAQDRATDGGTLLTSATYVYDVFDHLIEEDVYTQATGITTVTRYGWDGNNAWADLNGSNQLTTRRLYLDGLDEVFARIAASGSAAWYLADRQGSIRDLVSLSGATLLDHLAYDGFGNVTQETNAANGDRFAYDGYWRDLATGYDLSWHRWYDPATGGWTTRDPSGFAAGDYNLTRYVGNAPTDGTDPTGLLKVGWSAEGAWGGLITGAVAGGAAGAIVGGVPTLGLGILPGIGIGVVVGGVAGLVGGGLGVGTFFPDESPSNKFFLGGSIGIPLGFCSGFLGLTAAEAAAPVIVPAAQSAWAGVVGWFATHPDQAEDEAEVIFGPGGQTTRSALERLADSGGSTTEVFTRLSQEPQAGRSLSVAVGNPALANAVPNAAADKLFSGQIPNALLKELLLTGLAQKGPTINMGPAGPIQGTEISFDPAVTQFIVPLLKRVGL